MSRYIGEILDAANKDINNLKQHFGNSYLRNLLESAYLPEKKFLLPEGTPPYRASDLHESQLAGAFWQIAKKIDAFRRPDVKPLFREKSFIGALESLSKKDAEILLAVKDQKLDSLYPNLTYGKLRNIGYFPG